MSRVAETIINLTAKVVLPLADWLVSRRERKQPRPPLDERLKSLSIEEAAARAEADRKAKYGQR